MNELRGKVALVTGASKGIGAGIARGLAAAGAAVAINYVADEKGAQKAVAAIVKGGGKAAPIQGDVSRATDIQRIFDGVIAAFGGLDILVNNAGVYTFQALEAISEIEFHRQFDTNVLAPIMMTQAALKYFPATGGSVINISSISSKNPPDESALYASTKGAIDTLTLALAKELGPRKIRVNSVAPGVIDTEGVRTAGVIGSPFEISAVAQTPLGRIGTPGDIAPVVVFLASDAAAWVTGERITASGGYF
jgi:3-oxoacyl-[acyl-carrier protein] reductase